MIASKVAIIGTGNIGTDLMIKVLRTSRLLQMGIFAGIDPDSDGLKRARRMGVSTTASGIEGLMAMPEFDEIEIVFDATSASAHHRHASLLSASGRSVVDLTPAAVGPYVIPSVNGDAYLDEPNVNMVTCGGQATIPIVAAISGVTKVLYAEIVASIASKSAGPGTRANIDEFTETTARALVDVGRAGRGKAIIVLNPAEPPLIMRDTVYCLAEKADQNEITRAIQSMVEAVREFVPGYRLKQEVQFERVDENQGPRIPETRDLANAVKVSVFLEVEGAAHYLPAYSGNLDIMTSAALRTGERIAARRHARKAA
jgi:acetaldehyde dehydrogenase